MDSKELAFAATLAAAQAGMDAAMERLGVKVSQGDAAAANPEAPSERVEGITLQDYIKDYWLPILKKRVEPETAASYEKNARINIPASLKAQAIQTIKRGQLKKILSDLIDKPLAPATVASVANVMRSIFASAVDDELIPANPAEKIGRTLGLHVYHVENIKAMEASQLETFLTVAREKEPAHYVELAVLAFTGMRIGELRGLQVDDLDLPGRKIMVNRQVHEDGTVSGPKGRRGRRKTRVVDMADDLAFVLELLLQSRRAFDMRMARRSPWLLYPDFSDQPTSGQVSTVTHRLRRSMRRVLKLSKLPDYFTPHALRHTFATLLLQRGEDLLYVARQLGDTLPIASEIYGRHAKVPSRQGGPNVLNLKAVLPAGR